MVWLSLSRSGIEKRKIYNETPVTKPTKDVFVDYIHMIMDLFSGILFVVQKVVNVKNNC